MDLITHHRHEGSGPYVPKFLKIESVDNLLFNTLELSVRILFL